LGHYDATQLATRVNDWRPHPKEAGTAASNKPFRDKCNLYFTTCYVDSFPRILLVAKKKIQQKEWCAIDYGEYHFPNMLCAEARSRKRQALISNIQSIVEPVEIDE